MKTVHLKPVSQHNNLKTERPVEDCVFAVESDKSLKNIPPPNKVTPQVDGTYPLMDSVTISGAIQPFLDDSSDKISTPSHDDEPVDLECSTQTTTASTPTTTTPLQGIHFNIPFTELDKPYVILDSQERSPESLYDQSESRLTSDEQTHIPKSAQKGRQKIIKKIALRVASAVLQK